MRPDGSGKVRHVFPPFAEDHGQDRPGPALIKGAGPDSGLVVILVAAQKAKGLSAQPLNIASPLCFASDQSGQYRLHAEIIRRKTT